MLLGVEEWVGAKLEEPKCKVNLSCTVAPCLKRKPNYHKKGNKYKDMGKLVTKYKKNEIICSEG